MPPAAPASVSLTSLIIIITLTPLPLAAVEAFIQNAPLLMLAVPSGTARAASAPSLPTCRVAQDAVVVDEKPRMPVIVELIAAVGAVVAYQLVVAAFGEPIEVALFVLAVFFVVALVDVVVEKVDG